MVRSMRTRPMAETEPQTNAADDFNLAGFLSQQLLVTANRVSRIFAHRFAAVLGLSVWEWRLLATLGRVTSASPTSVTEMAAMNKVDVSRAVAGLKARKLLKQTANKSDGREHVLRLTAKGTSTYRRAVALAQDTEREVFAGMSRADVETLHTSLGQLLVHIGDPSEA